VWTSIDATPNVAGRVFRHARRAIDANNAATPCLHRAVQPSPSMSAWTAFHQPPTFSEGIIHGLSYVLIRMIVHVQSLGFGLFHISARRESTLE
jgi:hypothetical protein